MQRLFRNKHSVGKAVYKLQKWLNGWVFEERVEINKCILLPTPFWRCISFVLFMKICLLGLMFRFIVYFILLLFFLFLSVFLFLQVWNKIEQMEELLMNGVEKGSFKIQKKNWNRHGINKSEKKKGEPQKSRCKETTAQWWVFIPIFHIQSHLLRVLSYLSASPGRQLHLGWPWAERLGRWSWFSAASPAQTERALLLSLGWPESTDVPSTDNWEDRKRLRKRKRKRNKQTKKHNRQTILPEYWCFAG